jgi:hypothetical protein
VGGQAMPRHPGRKRHRPPALVSVGGGTSYSKTLAPNSSGRSALMLSFRNGCLGYDQGASLFNPSKPSSITQPKLILRSIL